MFMTDYPEYDDWSFGHVTPSQSSWIRIVVLYFLIWTMLVAVMPTIIIYGTVSHWLIKLSNATFPPAIVRYGNME